MWHSNFNTIIYHTTGTWYLINKTKTSIEWLVRKCVFCNIKREGFQCNNCQNVNKSVKFFVNPGFLLLNYHEMLKILHWNVMLLDNLYCIYRIVVPRNWAFISHSLLSTSFRHQNTTKSNPIWDQNNPYILTFNYHFLCHYIYYLSKRQQSKKNFFT